jgi:Heparinase II/III-like protein/Heparinase II/III N-terminus
MILPPNVEDAVVRLRRVPPRRLPMAVGRYALRAARARANRWRIQRSRGELSDQTFLRALGDTTPDEAFDCFLRRFFVDPAEGRRRARALAEQHPSIAERTRACAERTLEHVFDLLGSGPVQLRDRIDWHTDFRSGIEFVRYGMEADHDSLRLNEPCDVKIPWELSRCHHWVGLGRAYALDGDPRFAREFVSQLEAWLDDNPWPYGVNWGRAMEAAVRAVNWLWTAALFAEAPEFSAPLKARMLKSLLQHGRHVLDNLEISDNNGNHYLSNGVGLLFLGVLLAEFADADAWRRKGFEIVWGEIQRQVHPDGVDFEQAIGYHGLVLEFWYSSVVLCQRNGIEVPVHVQERLARMFDFVLAYTRPDGTFPQIGDNDDGRLAGLDDEPVGSHRRHIGVGGAMYGRADLLAAAGNAIETAVWLCGTDVLDQPRLPAEVRSAAFPAGGFYVMRAPDMTMVIDVAEVGMRGIGGHGHNDVLSFELWAGGATLLADSGTYTYSADAMARQVMRSTAAHNTLRIDGEETSRLGTGRWLWRIENDARPTVHRWTSGDECDVLDASHDGYRRLPQPVTHRRRIVFDKRRRAWSIHDFVDGTGTHLAELFFHPAVAFDVELGGVRLVGPRADLWLFGPSQTEMRQQPGWISRGYGYREPATVLVFSMRGRVPLDLRTRLVLTEPGTSSAAARCLLDGMREDN